MTVQHHFTVYGDAELFKGSSTRVWPKQVLIREGIEIPDAWLNWGSCSMTGGPARWRRIRHKTLWERLRE